MHPAADEYAQNQFSVTLKCSTFQKRTSSAKALLVLGLKCAPRVRRIVCFLPPEREDDTMGQSVEHPWSERIRDVIEMLHKRTHTH